MQGEQEGFHRKPLPDVCISFESEKGTALLMNSLTNQSGRSVLRLLSVFQTQQEPAYCALASLCTALNALAIDPQRIWKGVWRWFSEDLLRCCVPLRVVAEQGIALEETACLARCNGTSVSIIRPPESLWIEPQDKPDPDLWSESQANQFEEYVEKVRGLLHRCCDGPSGATVDEVLIAGYDRKALQQTGSGHFSPLGAVDWESDHVLILDVARFKLPPHWVPIPALAAATLSKDPSTGKSRGFLVIGRKESDCSAPMPALQFHSLYESLHRRVDQWNQEALNLQNHTASEIIARAQEIFVGETDGDGLSALIRPFQASCCGEEKSVSCCGREKKEIQGAVERCKPSSIESGTWVHLLLVRDRLVAPFASHLSLQGEIWRELTIPKEETLLRKEIKRLQHLLDFFPAKL